MPVVNPLAREVTFKLVFYGPGLGGKSTTLQHIHDASDPQHRGKMVSLATAVDRTLYFDYLPVRLPAVRGLSVRIQLFTVPGQVYYNATRKLVLTGADGVVLVIDSQEARGDANIESLENLQENLAEQKRDLRTTPFVVQYNKRDLPGVLPISELQRFCNPTNAPFTETVALTGLKVFETLECITKLVLDEFDKTHPASAGGHSLELAPSETGLLGALRASAIEASPRSIAIVHENVFDKGTAPSLLLSEPPFDPEDIHPASDPLKVPRTPRAPSIDRAALFLTHEDGSPATQEELRTTPAPPAAILAEPSLALNGRTLPTPAVPLALDLGVPSSSRREPQPITAVPSPALPRSSAQGRSRQAVPGAPEGISLVSLWPTSEQELAREIEQLIATNRLVEAVQKLDLLVHKTLASVAALLGASAPREPALVVLLLGVNGGRFLAFRSLVHQVRAGLPPPPNEVLEAYLFAHALRLGRTSHAPYSGAVTE